MIGLDSTKKSFLDIYKMDLAETMKQVLSSKGSVGGALSSLQQLQQSALTSSSAMQHTIQQQQQQQQQQQHQHQQQQQNDGSTGIGYVTEKLYMLLQLYLQNKGWNPSVELLQCFSELKDSALLPSAAYLQVLANRLALDTQGRLVLRESGKIVLPYEHFANAVMLKHMTGPHGLHLSVEATVRAVIESYTIGRENFGMEKEFIIEVVQSCPNPACRYYKNHLGVGPPFMDPAFQAAAAQMSSEYMQHLPQMAAAASVDMTQVDLSVKQVAQQISSQNQRQAEKHAKALASQQAQAQQHQAQAQAQAQAQQQQQQQITAAIIQQQNRAIAQQNLEKFGNLSAIEKQRVLQQLDKKHYEAAAHVAASLVNSPSTSMTPQNLVQSSVQLERGHEQRSPSASLMGVQQSHQQAHQQSHPQTHQAVHPQNLSSQVHQQHHLPQSVPHSPSASSSSSSVSDQHKVTDFVRSNMDTIDTAASIATNKDLLALHNGAWGMSSNQQQQQQQQQTLQLQQTQQLQQQQQQLLPQQQQQHQPQQQQQHQPQQQQPLPQQQLQQDNRDTMSAVSQDKIIRAFGELMRNMARMKTFIRPSMCKPYGKQSESLQKTLVDTIQLVQSLRSCLPAPHIPVSSWKSEDRHI